MTTTTIAFGKPGAKEQKHAMEDVRQLTKEERAIFLNNARNDEKISDKELVVLKYVEFLTRIYGVAWATNAYFVQKLGYSDRSITRYITNLISKGYLLRNFIYHNGKIYRRVLALNWKKAKEAVKKTAIEIKEVLVGIHTSRKQFLEYLRSIEKEREFNVENSINNPVENSFCNAVGGRFDMAVGGEDILSTKNKEEVILSKDKITTRTHANNSDFSFNLDTSSKKGYERETYNELIERKVKDSILQEVLKAYIKQRILIHKAPTNKILEELIDELHSKFYTNYRRVETVEKMTKYCWLSIDRPNKGKKHCSYSKYNRKKAYENEPWMSSLSAEDIARYDI